MRLIIRGLYETQIPFVKGIYMAVHSQNKVDKAGWNCLGPWLVSSHHPSMYPWLCQSPTLAPIAPAQLPSREKTVIALGSVQLAGDGAHLNPALHLNLARVAIADTHRSSRSRAILSSDWQPGQSKLSTHPGPSCSSTAQLSGDGTIAEKGRGEYTLGTEPAVPNCQGFCFSTLVPHLAPYKMVMTPEDRRCSGSHLALAQDLYLQPPPTKVIAASISLEKLWPTLTSDPTFPPTGQTQTA